MKTILSVIFLFGSLNTVASELSVDDLIVKFQNASEPNVNEFLGHSYECVEVPAFQGWTKTSNFSMSFTQNECNGNIQQVSDTAGNGRIFKANRIELFSSFDMRASNHATIAYRTSQDGSLIGEWSIAGDLGKADCDRKPVSKEATEGAVVISYIHCSKKHQSFELSLIFNFQKSDQQTKWSYYEKLNL